VIHEESSFETASFAQSRGEAMVLLVKVRSCSRALILLHQ